MHYTLSHNILRATQASLPAKFKASKNKLGQKKNPLKEFQRHYALSDIFR